MGHTLLNKLYTTDLSLYCTNKIQKMGVWCACACMCVMLMVKYI